jgi:ABC-2 type transport system permease protein
MTGIVGLGVVMLIIFVSAYNVLTAQALVRMGEQDLIPAYMVSVSSYATLILTVLRSNGILFGSRDMDMLSALPVKAHEIISSKFLFMYLLNIILSLIFMFSGGIVWIMYAPADYLLFVLYFISIFFVPLIPMCIASFVGLLVVVASSYFKNRNIFALIFSFATLGLVGYISYLSIHSGNNIDNIGAMLANQVTGLYPLSKLFLKHTLFPASFSLGIFLLISCLVLIFFMKLVSVKYNNLNALANSSSKYTGSCKAEVKQQSQFVALYKKEFRRFLSSYMAVLNTGLGVILLCLFSICLLIMPLEQLGQFAGLENMNNFLSEYAPIVIAAMLSLSCPAASSISLEGKNIWILQCAPVSSKQILNSKLAVNLTLHAIAYILAVISITVRLKLNLFQQVSILLIPIAYSVFTAVLGVSLNKKYPNYTWENEMLVVKQSLPVIAANMVCMSVVALPVLLHLWLSISIIPLTWSIAVIIFIAAIIMYQRACKADFF